MNLIHGNLSIRTVRDEDLKALWKLMYQDNTEWMKWNGPYFHDPIHTQEEFMNDIGPKHYVNKNNIGVIEVDGAMCGIMSCHFEDEKLAQWLEFGLVIHNEKQWGQGIGKRSCCLWMDYMFQRYSYLPHIGFTTWSGNKRMIQLGESLGMKLEARIRNVRYYEGQYWDSIKYGILKEEFQVLKNTMLKNMFDKN